MPARQTVLDWLHAEPEFAAQYARAREAQADLMGEEILDIADDSRNDSFVDEDGQTHVNFDHIQRSRLRVDARKWLMGKMAPKKYGDKLLHAGADGEGPLVVRVISFADKRPAE